MPPSNQIPPDTGEDYFRWFEGFDPFTRLTSQELHVLDEADASSNTLHSATPRAQPMSPGQATSQRSNIAFPTSFNVNAYATRRVDAQAPPVARVNAPNPAPPQNSITAPPALPATFNPNAYSTGRTYAEPAVRAYAHREQHMRGLRLPEVIAEDTELWKLAGNSVLRMIKIVDTAPESNSEAGIVIILEPRLEAWCGNRTRKRAKTCANGIYKAVNPKDTKHKLRAADIIARMGLMPHAGGFSHEVCEKIQANINHLLKHMLWALDLDGMRKNNYQFYVPADRYRFARMLGLNPPDQDMHLEFDIVSMEHRNKGEKVGVWRGFLSQLTEEKGDQRKIPTKLQCELLLHDMFDAADVNRRAGELKLDMVNVRTCFANEKEDVSIRYQQALALSRSAA